MNIYCVTAACLQSEWSRCGPELLYGCIATDNPSQGIETNRQGQWTHQSPLISDINPSLIALAVASHMSQPLEQVDHGCMNINDNITRSFVYQLVSSDVHSYLYCLYCSFHYNAPTQTVECYTHTQLSFGSQSLLKQWTLKELL